MSGGVLSSAHRRAGAMLAVAAAIDMLPPVERRAWRGGTSGLGVGGAICITCIIYIYIHIYICIYTIIIYLYDMCFFQMQGETKMTVMAD